eukprot:1142770-Pelagomonas_calceolata.AAC.3
MVKEGVGRDRGQQSPYRLASAFHPLTLAVSNFDWKPPASVIWFTGEIASPMDEFDMDEDEMEEDYADMPGMKGGR